MNIDWKIFCDRLTDSIWNATQSLIGTEEAAIKMKKYRKNTKKIDAVAENTVIDHLKKEKMDVILVSEEIGEIQIGSKPKYTIVLDPIDGTTNSIRGLPFFATSIAIAKGKLLKDLIFGYVRNYLTGEVFHVNQKDAFYNDQKCQGSTCKTLGRALISIYSYSNVNYEIIRKILMKIRKMRLLGAISVELMYVGCNILDGLIDLRGNSLITDIAAGILFIKKAGGVASQSNGEEITGPIDIHERYSIVAAGNKELYKNFIKIITT